MVHSGLSAVRILALLSHCGLAVHFSAVSAAACFHHRLQPADATIDNPPADLFTKAGWAEFASGFWLGGCGGAAFAWFLTGTALVAPLVNIAGGVWSVN